MNNYPGFCISCDRRVPAGHGNLVKRNGRWMVQCSKSAKRSSPKRGSAKPSRPSPKKSSRSEPPAGPRVSRAQGKDPFEVGATIAAILTSEEIAAAEARQGLSAVEVPGAPSPGGRRRVACMVEWETSLTSHEVEELDAWSHQHTAVVRLATPEEAAALVEAREREQTKGEAAKTLRAALGEAQGYDWRAPEGTVTVARDYRPGTMASLPYLVATPEGQVYHVEPIYDDSPIVKLVHMSREDAVETARSAGWQVP